MRNAWGSLQVMAAKDHITIPQQRQVPLFNSNAAGSGASGPLKGIGDYTQIGYI